MAPALDLIVGVASTVTRLGAFAFLRWIPGHHFPSIIVSAAAIYLTLVTAYSSSFGTRPSLREAFPKLFRHEHASKEHSTDSGLDTEHDEPALYKEEVNILKTLVFGIPNWHEWEFTYITIGLNVLVTLLSLDLVFRGPALYDGEKLKFSRLGYVDHTSARVLMREPDPHNLPVYVYLKPSAKTNWSAVDKVYYTQEETDYTYPIVFEGLQPDTAYAYSLSNDLGGTFRTAPAPSSAAAKSLTFLTSSCIKANFPYNPFAHSLSIHGFKYMSKVLKSLPSPASFMLFLGDFIYVDVPFRLSSTQEHYRSEYRRVYASPSWKLPGFHIPWIHTLDDHEIANDWAGGNETEPFPAASDPFIHYHASVNPPLPPSAPDGPETNTTYFQFTQGPASFFMMDTRRYRTEPETEKSAISDTTKPLYGSSSASSQATEYGPSMLGPEQLQALLAFLQTPEGPNVHWKFVASSVPFTKNWRFGTSDTWGGFLSERKRILDAMHFAEASLGVRVIILSGDRHEFAAVRFPPRLASEVSDPTSSLGPHEFSVGPLSMFYLPFRTFKQVDDEDVALAYFPDGNSKLGSIHIEPATGASRAYARSTLTYKLWVDGTVAWEYYLDSPVADGGKRTNLDTWKIWH
ncbi:hypothetical protein PMZ80_010564 [Knufia obscura]|uniref:PhoD-like phosphatase metallophosphatase domain-containing protein n=1 Tax=Knufia obscura TaxID=1635080 RepID=A0ABR0RAP9_9EURO|nr:hypothetical protein PMZ80_010564 [Knufia obscura]